MTSTGPVERREVYLQETGRAPAPKRPTSLGDLLDRAIERDFERREYLCGSLRAQSCQRRAARKKALAKKKALASTEVISS